MFSIGLFLYFYDNLKVQTDLQHRVVQIMLFANDGNKVEVHLPLMSEFPLWATEGFVDSSVLRPDLKRWLD